MNETAMQFDNHDSHIKYYELLLERDLENLPCFSVIKNRAEYVQPHTLLFQN